MSKFNQNPEIRFLCCLHWFYCEAICYNLLVKYRIIHRKKIAARVWEVGFHYQSDGFKLSDRGKLLLIQLTGAVYLEFYPTQWLWAQQI